MQDLLNVDFQGTFLLLEYVEGKSTAALEMDRVPKRIAAACSSKQGY